MIEAWRMVKAEYADDAFSGDGAVLYAGRWHSEGTRVVYTSESVALATLESLVHIRHMPLPDYVIIPCYFHEALVEDVDVNKLAENWFAPDAPLSLRQLGDAWARNRVSAALKVPSAVTLSEFNYMLNPEHPDFESIDIGQPRAFQFDYRLIT